jgi:hypothetical protein
MYPLHSTGLTLRSLPAAAIGDAFFAHPSSIGRLPEKVRAENRTVFLG